MGKDRTSLRFLPFWQPYLFLASMPIGAYLGGWGYYLPLLLLYVFHPIVDRLGGENAFDEPTSKSESFFFDLPLWIFVPIYLGVLTWGMFDFVDSARGVFERIGLILGAGVIGASCGITMAHELIHRRRYWERGLGVTLFGAVSYMPFRLTHVYWHHPYVATNLDPASAPEGMSVYRFWLRALRGTFSQAWLIERERLRRQGNDLHFWENRVTHYFVIQVIVMALIMRWWGPLGLAYFLGQGVIAILMLETINYVEHYGLVRLVDEHGRPEPVTDRHSWDATFRFSNWYLFNLGRHAHHHMAPATHYEQLKLSKGSPKMPYGYSTMFLLALFPPLWRSVMHPRIRAYEHFRENDDHPPRSRRQA